MTIKTLVKLTTLAGLLAWALPAHAGKFYNLDQKTSSATLRVGYEGADRNDAVFISSGAAIVQSTSATTTHAFFRALNNAGTAVLQLTQSGVLTVSSFVGDLTGTASLATLATNVTTNANLTGPITSVGNATTIVGPVPTTAVNLSTVTTKFDAVGSSTQTIQLNVGISTLALRTDFNASTTTLSASTASLAALKLSSPTVSGTVGQVISLGSNGTPTWASAGGGGDMTTTGSNTMAVTSTITATDAGTSPSNNRIVIGQYPVMRGIWHTIASTNVAVAVASTTFQHNFSTKTWYEAVWEGALQAGANNISLRFGSGGTVDTGNNYSVALGVSLLASAGNQQADATSSCRISYINATDYNSSGEPFIARVRFKPTAASANKVIATVETRYHSTDRATQVTVFASCTYSGSAPVNVIQFYSDSGATWKGTLEINAKDPTF